MLASPKGLFSEEENCFAKAVMDWMTWGKPLPSKTRFIHIFQEIGLTVGIVDMMEKSK